MTGKDQCDYLKRVRAEIAKKNGIDGFEYKKCPYEGPCSGTCPACDAETEALYSILKVKGADVDAIMQEIKMIPIDELKQYQTAGMPDLLMGDMIIEREPGRIIDNRPKKSDLSGQDILEGELNLDGVYGNTTPETKSFKQPNQPNVTKPHKLRGKVIDNRKLGQQNDSNKAKPRGLLNVFKRKNG